MKAKAYNDIKNRWLIEIISASLLLLFLYAALSKLIRYDVFVFQVSESPFRLLAKSAHWAAWMIPVAEIVVAAMLPFAKTRLFGFYCAAGLMLVFTIYIAAMLLSGLPLPCACGGIIAGLQWPGHLMFNIFFLIISMLGIRLQRKNEALRSKNRLSAYTMGTA